MANAAANLLGLREFSLASTWPRLSSLSEQQFDEYLASMGLLWTKRRCPGCGERREMYTELSASGEAIRAKFRCHKRACRQPGIKNSVGILADTFFETTKGDRKLIFLASYFFCTSKNTLEQVAKDCGVDVGTVCRWFQWFRDILVEHFQSAAPRLGGPGTVVQVDETHVARRKYHRGRRVRKEWLVGGIQDGTRLCFYHMTSSRDGPTLDGIIQRYVAPGGIVRTDQWLGYSNLRNLGYVHETVNHSQNFVDPVTGIHTQRVESLWSCVKKQITPKNGLKGQLWDDHFAEALFKFEKKEEDLFYEFWKAVAARYPID